MSVRIVYTLVYCVFDLQKQYKNENCIHRASWGGGGISGFLLQALLYPLYVANLPSGILLDHSGSCLGRWSVISCWGTKHRSWGSGAIVAIFARKGSY